MTGPEDITINPNEQPIGPEQEWYTPKEVAQKFRVDPKTVVRWFKSERFNQKVQVVETPGGHRRYRKTDIDALFDVLNPHLKKPE